MERKCAEGAVLRREGALLIGVQRKDGKGYEEFSAFDERCKAFVVAPADRIIDEGAFDMEWVFF